MFKKSKSKNPLVPSTGLKIKKTVQDSIPYYMVHEDQNIIEIEEGVFTKGYEFNDINFSAAKEEEQLIMYNDWCKILNGFPPSMRVSVTSRSVEVRQEDFVEEVLLDMKEDGYDELRQEQNEILLAALSQGNSNLERFKNLTVTLAAQNVEEAHQVFMKFDTELASSFQRLSKNSKLRPMTLTQRLSVLHDIYNPDNAGNLDKVFKNTKNDELISDIIGTDMYENIKMLGLNTKDVIAPASMEFNKLNHFKLGEKYGRVLFAQTYPSQLSTNFLTSLMDVPITSFSTITLQAKQSIEASKLISNQRTMISAELTRVQKQASKSGYDSQLVSPTLRQQHDDISDLAMDMHANDQNLFTTSLHIVIYADSLEELDMKTKTIENIGLTSMMMLKPLLGQQEQGFNTALPLGRKDTSIDRVLKTESLGVLLPFNTQELNHRNGTYYGENAQSGSIIRYDRRSAQNFNGFILGMSGSGKSFAAKNEITQQLLKNPNDNFIIIDPENEYSPLADYFGGSVIEIQNGIGSIMNPFDMDVSYGDDENGKEKDPRSAKSLMIQSFIEQIHRPIVHGYGGLDASEKSIIDIAVRDLFDNEFMDYLNTFRYGGENYGKKQDLTKNPTLEDFYNKLLESPSPDAHRIAQSLKMYVLGSIDIFNGHTNVDLSNRFIVFNTQQTETNIRSIALQQILDLAWNTVLQNQRKGIDTWIYIDEIYLLFKTPAQSEYVRDLYKRARKYGASITGISQNIDELINNEEARLMIANSSFLLLFNQTKTDRNEFAELLNMSPTELDYITSATPGVGLLYDGANITPFKNTVPKDTKLFELMTSSMTDRIKIKEEKMRKEKEAQ